MRIMGLDGVELVIEVEDHFGITIQDATAEGIRTVGDLVELVHDRLSNAQRTHCASLPAFLSLRTTVRESTGNKTLRIRPRDKIVEVLTPTQRCELWKRLPNLIGKTPPQLRRPPALRYTLTVMALALLSFAMWSAALIELQILPLTLAVAGFAIYCLHLCTLRFRVTPPQGYQTFGEITRRIVGTTAATKQLSLRSFDDVFLELRPIIAETIGVEKGEVVLTARFIEDLDVG